MIKVAVVILNYNGKPYLKKFLPSVTKYSNLPDVEIYVADNGSSDGSIHLINTLYPEINTILFDRNYGFAEGYNKALNQINTKYFILLNSDVEVTNNWIYPIIRIMDNDKSIAACMPKIMSYSQKDQFEYAGAAGGFIDKYGYPFCQGRILNIIEKDHGQFDTLKEIFWASGACLFVRADLFKKTGGFDNDFFCHMEEIDLCWRFKNRELKIMFCHEVSIYHVGGGTLPNENPKKLFYNFRNNLLLLYKNLAPDKLVPTILIRLILDGMAAIIFLFSFSFKSFFAVVKAHIEFFYSLKKIKTKRKELNKTVKTYNHPEIYKNSIIFDFFIRKRKTFQQLNANISCIAGF